MSSWDSRELLGALDWRAKLLGVLRGPFGGIDVLDRDAGVPTAAASLELRLRAGSEGVEVANARDDFKVEETDGFPPRPRPRLLELGVGCGWRSAFELKMASPCVTPVIGLGSDWRFGVKNESAGRDMLKGPRVLTESEEWLRLGTSMPMLLLLLPLL